MTPTSPACPRCASPVHVEIVAEGCEAHECPTHGCVRCVITTGPATPKPAPLEATAPPVAAIQEPVPEPEAISAFDMADDSPLSQDGPDADDMQEPEPVATAAEEAEGVSAFALAGVEPPQPDPEPETYPAESYLSLPVGVLVRIDEIHSNVPLVEVLKSTRSPRPQTVQRVAKARQLKRAGNDGAYQRAKIGPGWTPGGSWGDTPGPHNLDPGRRYAKGPLKGQPKPVNPIFGTGMAPLDVDIDMEGVDADALAKELLEKSYVLAVFRSIGGEGLCVIVALAPPGTTLTKPVFRARITACARDLSYRHATENGKVKQSNIGRLRFASDDPKADWKEGETPMQPFTRQAADVLPEAPADSRRPPAAGRRGRLLRDRLDKSADKVRTAQERHPELYAQARLWAGHFRRAEIDGYAHEAPSKEEARRTLVAAVMDAGYRDEGREAEANRTFDDAWAEGYAKPCEPLRAGSESRDPMPRSAPGAALDTVLDFTKRR